MFIDDSPHPAGIVRRQFLEQLELSVTRAVGGLEVTRPALSEFLNGHIGVSIEMAGRLSKALGATPEAWLGAQMAYHLWQAQRRAMEIAVGRFALA